MIAATSTRSALADAPNGNAGFDTSDTPSAAGVATEYGVMIGYSQRIPGTQVDIEMVPAPGGVARIAVGELVYDEDTCVVTPASAEAAENFVEVELPPFWIGRYEVTWEQYWEFMRLEQHFGRMHRLRQIAARDRGITLLLEDRDALRRALADADDLDAVDAVSSPTKLYDDTAYESGKDGRLPAVSMTPFAARQFTKWLSRVTGVHYRLPSEAEWEHAALAGDAPESRSPELDRMSWHADNSDWVAHPVGAKAANRLGLHDTLGNAAELVLDACRFEGRPPLIDRRVGWNDGVAWPVAEFPMVAKGGHWDSDPADLHAGSRLVTSSTWKDADPNLPRSPWWFSEWPANSIGFRIVRPLSPLNAETASRVWGPAVPSVADAVEARVKARRGRIGLVGREFPAAIEQLDSPPIRARLDEASAEAP